MSEPRENEEELVGNDGSLHDSAAVEHQPIAEPEYTKANQLKFATVCKRLEALWNQRSNASNKQTKEERLKYLLPPELHEHLAGASPFPLFRLIVPELDTLRPHSGMKEKTIATAWAGALGLEKGNSAYLKLSNYTDPKIAGNAAGDLTVVLKKVLEDRIPCEPSETTLGQINKMLDELANIRKPTSKHLATSHDWRDNSGGGSSRSKTKSYKAPNKKDQQVQWVTKLIRLGLSPLEHKWIARIILQKLEIGVAFKSILGYYSPWAQEVYDANNSLKQLCDTLSDPNWVRRRQEQEKRTEELIKQGIKEDYMPRSKAKPAMGNTLAPMLSQRTYFSKALEDITDHHRKFAKNMSIGEKGSSSLALKFPAFICEVKLDGERMITHIKRGIVAMQTRNSKWYSQLYSPVLGPPLRRAIARYDVDVILDGEVTAWDDGKKKTIPFGENRTVAAARREYWKRRGMIDERDLNLHEEDDDMNVTRATSDWYKPSSSGVGQDAEHEEGAECWLKYVLFDILYVGGPGASDLISQCVSSSTKWTTGSIVDLDAFERKKVLYRLIEPQENEVAIVPSLVVRPNGTSVDAADYFSPTNPSTDSGYPSSTLDSIECALRGDVADLANIEKELRSGRSDSDISLRRAAVMEEFYQEIVERRCLEGLIFKDLASPYCLGADSRNKKYWLKLKPDHNESGHAADLDVVVIGASYATGLGRAGLLNQFLVGCVDPENPGKYMTLVRVSGGGTKRETMDQFLRQTGFKKGSDTEQLSYGKWFQETEHGRSLPDFLSKRSFQRSRKGDYDGWKFKRDDYPNLWIHPNDSVVLTLTAGEIIAGDAFSAGVTLRFPRISKVRLGEDEKEAKECESVDELHRLFREKVRRATSSEDISFDSGSPSRHKQGASRRFLTVEESSRKRLRTSPRKRESTDSVKWQMPKVEEVKSTAFQGLKFVVLEGTFVLDHESLDTEEAKEQNWYDEAKQVRSRDDVMKFITLHSGTCMLSVDADTDYILGGRKDDARVSTYSSAFATASREESGRTTKKDQNMQKILQLGGVLKWTFAYSMIHRWNSADPLSRAKRGSIMSSTPELLNPRRHDFLVLSSSKEVALGLTDDVFGLDLNNELSIVDFKRAMQQVKMKNHPQRDADSSSEAESSLPLPLPWQYAAFEALEPEERWVMAGERQCVWPYRSRAGLNSAENLEPLVLYPHLFRSFGFLEQSEATNEVLAGVKSSRWDDLSPDLECSAVASSLSLARLMGFQVTPHLHRGVTHVLCDLRDDDSLVWTDGLGPDAFSPGQFSEPLRQRLIAANESSENGGGTHRVTLVSPHWIHRQWDSHRAPTEI